MSKVLLVAAGMAGYVLGARDGRRRYEQLKASAHRIWTDPRVQQKTTQATEAVKAKAPAAKEQLTSAARRATSKARSGAEPDGAATRTPSPRTSSPARQPGPGKDVAGEAGRQPTPPVGS